MLRDLTLVIFTLGRLKYLIDLLNYWSELNTEVKILILDGSDIPINIGNLNLPENFKANIKSTSIPSLWDRFEYASLNIETKYAVWHADDDFLLPSGLQVALNQISNTRDTCIFSNVRGFSLDHLQKPHSIKIWRERYELNSENPFDRALKFANNRANRYYYAIWPTDLFKKALHINAISSRTVKSEKLIFGDIGLELAGCLLAKLQIANSNFYLKRVGLESQPTTTNMPTLSEFINSHETKKDFERWLYTFSIEMVKQAGFELKTILSRLNEFFLILVNKEIAQKNRTQSSYIFKFTKLYLSINNKFIIKLFTRPIKIMYRTIYEPRRGVPQKKWDVALRKEKSQELVIIKKYLDHQVDYSRKVI